MNTRHDENIPFVEPQPGECWVMIEKPKSGVKYYYDWTPPLDRPFIVLYLTASGMGIMRSNGKIEPKVEHLERDAAYPWLKYALRLWPLTPDWSELPITQRAATLQDT
jgi:hypothetical protein